MLSYRDNLTAYTETLAQGRYGFGLSESDRPEVVRQMRAILAHYAESGEPMTRLGARAYAISLQAQIGPQAGGQSNSKVNYRVLTILDSASGIER
jgi:hypothetical protein